MPVEFFHAADGARLAYRDEGAGLPVLCLAGLTRSMDDFDYLAPALADIIGDYRTESLARALIEARRHHEAALAEVMADSASDAQTDELRKQG